MHYHLEILPPSHPDGHKTLWFWCIRTTGDIAISGTSDELSDASDVGTSALQDLIHEEQT